MTRKVHKIRDQETNENTFELDPENHGLSLPGRTRRNWRLCKVFLMDQEFAFRPKEDKGLRANFLKLYNTHGKLVTICPSTTKLLEWNEALTAVLRTQAAQDYIGYNRFGSFAPPRPNTQATVFIDGAYYMEAVARAIAQAQHEIFITDWCMNPELFLRRPIQSNTWRLDKLLQAKARQGVRICVILYAGIEKVVPFVSAKTAGHLHSLHPNIHVYRSPLIKWFWSHHEKMVAIDQSIVFMGGIDLCFGRWDTIDHR
ncbi:unnamed protein product [Echinostoma caproni]|uniref:phospholipase D n=1 Tax=Echinostoma caproni TaxID=27848 RepID=A0A183AVE8_9TREM|nr:unnamed protein product [Echinostoma caproni]